MRLFVLMELTTAFNVAYAKQMVENGADTWYSLIPPANAQLIGAEFYEKFVFSLPTGRSARPCTGLMCL
jgi:uroporphyrinogen-III decarboxylase